MAETGGKPGAGLGPVLAVDLKAMVNSEDQQWSARRSGPGVGDQRERYRIAAARKSDRQRSVEVRQKSAIKGLADRSLYTAHLAWVRVAAARLATLAGALG